MLKNRAAIATVTIKRCVTLSCKRWRVACFRHGSLRVFNNKNFGGYMKFVRKSGIGFVLFTALAAWSVSPSASALALAPVGLLAVSLCPSGGSGCWSGTWQSGSGISSWTNITADGSSWNATINDLSVIQSTLADPILSGNFTLTNTTALTQAYTMTSNLMTGPIGPSTLTFGNVTGTLTATGGGPAALSTSGSTPIYTALLDGSSFQTLLNSPFSMTATAASGPQTIVSSFGQLVPVSGPAVYSSMGTGIDFSLTPGATVNFSDVFQVQPVPVPPAFALFISGVIGLMGMAGITRRRAQR